MTVSTPSLAGREPCPAVPSDACPLGPELQESWELRHELFSRWDDGIRYDRVGLFGAKPEAAALRCAEALTGELVLDAFCGIGGSAIAFARAGKRVITAEMDLARLAMARHNARLYGVEQRILFVHGDVRPLLASLRVDCVYLDPPWGGTDAWERASFRLADYRPPADELLATALASAPAAVLSLPPNFDLGELDAWPLRTLTPVHYRGELLYYDALFAA